MTDRPLPLPPDFVSRQCRLAIQAAAGAAAFLLVSLAAAAYVAARVPLWQLAYAYLAAEALFVFLYRDKLKRFGSVPAEQRPSNHDGEEAARRFVRLTKYFPFSESYLRPWFRDAPMSLIRRENVKDLLSYGFWYKTKEEMAASGELPVLDDVLEQLQRSSGIELQDGATPGLPFMSHLYDALPASYRPLAFYGFTEYLGAMTHAMLWLAGFQRHNICGLVYYTLPGVQGGAEEAGRRRQRVEVPILVMHGVGAGVLPYLGLVITLAGTGRPMVIPEYRHVSMRLTDHVPTIEELVASTAGFLQVLGFDQVHVIGHSYGSLVASRFSQLHSKAVTSLTLLDPVCFAVFMPTLLYTFLYSFPSTGNFILDAGMYFVSREVHMTATFCRHFLWSDYNMWAEDLPRHLLVSLSGRDRLTEARGVHQWLTQETHTRVMYDPDRRHATVLMRPWQQREILQQWLEMAADSEGPHSSAADGAADARVAAEAMQQQQQQQQEQEQQQQQQLEVPAPRVARSPFTSTAHALAAAGPDALACKLLAGDALPGGSSAQEVQRLVRRLRQQQERVFAQEEANAAAAQQLLALAATEALRRGGRRAAAAAAAGPGYLGAGGLSLGRQGSLSLTESDVSSECSIGSDVIDGAIEDELQRGPLSGAAGGAAADAISDALELLRHGGGDVAVLGGAQSLYLPLATAGSLAAGGDGGGYPLAAGAGLRHRRGGLRRVAPGGPVGAKGSPLRDTMSIDLGALGHASSASRAGGGRAAAGCGGRAGGLVGGLVGRRRGGGLGLADAAFEDSWLEQRQRGGARAGYGGW